MQVIRGLFCSILIWWKPNKIKLPSISEDNDNFLNKLKIYFIIMFEKFLDCFLNVLEKIIAKRNKLFYKIYS